MADNDNRYTILISGKLDTASLTNIQKELDKMDNISVKVMANITKFIVKDEAISELKTYVQNKLGAIAVDVTPTSTSSGSGTGSTRGTGSSRSTTTTYTENTIRNNSRLLEQYEKIVQKVNDATRGAQARITVEADGEGIITRVNAQYSDLENKVRNVSYVVTETGELEQIKTRYIEDNIKKQKEQLAVLEKAEAVVTSMNKLLRESNPASAVTQQTQTVVDNLERTTTRARSYLTRDDSRLLSDSDVAFMKTYTESAKGAAQVQSELNGELERQSKYIGNTQSYAANLEKAASARAQSIPAVREAVSKSRELFEMGEQLNHQVSVDGIPLTKEQIDAYNALSESTKLAGTGFKQLGGDTKSFVHEIGVAISRTISWSIAMGAVYGTLNQIKQGISFISELDQQLTDIRIVTGDTADATARLAFEYNELARELGTTTQNVASGSLEFIRQGKTQAETMELMRVSTMQAKLANMDAAQSSEYLTSVMNGFNLEASDMMGVLDKLVILDNNYATSVSEIATALQRSAVSARLAGISLEELASMVTVVSSVSRQSAESIGESFKTIFARMQAVQLGADTDEEGEDISNVEQVLRKYNIALRDSVGEFRDLSEVLDEIAEKWTTYGSVAKSEIASTIAGVRQREKLLILLENYDKVKQAEILTTEAAGLAQERYGVYLESVEAKQQKFKATWEALWLATLNSDLTKVILDISTAILQLGVDLGGLVPILTTIVGLIVALNSAAVAGGIATLGTKISGLVTKLKAASTAATGLAGALTGIGVVLAVLGVAYGVYNAITEAHEKKVQAAADAVDAYVAKIENIPNKLSEAGDAVEEINKLFAKFAEGSLTTEDEQKLYQQYAILHELIPEYEKWHYSKKGWYLEEAISIEEVNDLINKQKTLTKEEEEAFVLTVKEKIKEYQKLVDAIEQANLDKKVSELFQEAMAQGAKEGKAGNRILYDLWLDLLKIPDGVITDAEKQARDIVTSYNNLLVHNLGDDDISTLIVDNFTMSQGQAEKAIVDNETAAETFAAGILSTWVSAGEELRQSLTDQFGGETTLFQVLNEMLVGTDKAPVANASSIKEAFKDFEDMIEKIASAMSGRAKDAFENFGQRVVSLNKSFEEGEISVRAYFDSLAEITANKDLIDLFDDTTDSAQRFFTTLFANGIVAIDSLNAEFEAGDIAITDYLDGLIGAQEMLDNQYDAMIANADAMGLTDEAVQQLTVDYEANRSALEASTQELVKMSDVSDLLRQGYDSVMSGDMFSEFQAGAETAIGYYQALSEAAWNYAQQSGFAFKDSEGNALNSVEAIYGYLTGGIGNFSNFSTQMTERVKAGILQQNQAIQEAMTALATVISTFKLSFHAVQGESTIINFPIPKLFGQIFQVDSFPLEVPGINMEGGASIDGTALGNFGTALSTIFNPQPNIPNFGNEIWSGGGGYNPVTTPTGGGGGGGGQSAEDTLRNEAEQAYQDLLAMTIAMLKNRAELAIKALKDELDAYKKLIKAKKDELNVQRQERKNQKEIETRTRTVTDLESELAQLQFDTSQEGIARRLELEEQLAEARRDLEDEEFEQRLQAQEDALDKELELYTDYIDAQIEELNRYLSEEGRIVREAQELIHGRTQEFYADLMEWNMTYGSGIAQDVIDAWRGAIMWIETFGMQGAQAVANFAGSASSSIGQINNEISDAVAQAAALASIFGSLGGGGFFITPNVRPMEYHTGGIVGDTVDLQEQEIFAKLLKGEVVATKEQAYNFMKSALPNMIQAGRESGGDINVEITIPVAGNLDKTVLPDLERAVSDAMMSIRGKAGLKTFSNLNTI